MSENVIEQTSMMSKVREVGYRVGYDKALDDMDKRLAIAEESFRSTNTYGVILELRRELKELRKEAG